MPLVIWKCKLKMTDIQEITVPDGAEMLSAREQFEKVCVWYRCDPLKEKVGQKIAIVGTGHGAPNDGKFLDTASLMGGSLILHVFAQ